MGITRAKHSRIAYAIILVTAWAMVPGALQAAETKDKMEDSAVVFCESYRTAMGYSSQKDNMRNDTMLLICDEGIIYKQASMNREILIPWRNVDRWRYYGPKELGSDPGKQQTAILRVVPTAGWGGSINDARLYTDLQFKVCCTAEDGYKIWTDMNKYRGARRF